MKYAEIYTAGHCQEDFGPGHWSVLIMKGARIKTIEGYVDKATRKRMELTAVIKGLRALKKPHTVEVITSSQYIKKGITKQVDRRKSNNGKTSKGNPVKNKDLWQELDEVMQKHQITWNWIKRGF